MTVGKEGRLREICVHEAAHAVIASFLMIEIVSVWVAADADSASESKPDWSGWVEYVNGNYSEEDRILVSCAGGEAVRLYLGEPNPIGCDRDEVSIDLALSRIAYAHLDLNGSVSLTSIEDTAEELSEMFRAACRSLLSDPKVKEAVETLSIVLEKKHELEGPEVEEIVRPILNDFERQTYLNHLQFRMNCLEVLKASLHDAIQVAADLTTGEWLAIHTR